MDFRCASQKLDLGHISEEAITREILNLPCLYGIFQSQYQVFCLEVNNKQTDSEITVVLLYSSLELAIEATSEFLIPSNWYVAQWSEIEEALQACLEFEVDAVAFDSLPEESSLNGLVIDKDSLKELIWLSLSTR